MITTHTQLLNYLIKKHNLKSYLEIGVQCPGNNFDLIECDKKIGVDPSLKGIPDPKNHQYFHCITSDEYFEKFKNRIGFLTETKTGVRSCVDLVFIDGHHTESQVKRDFENSLKCLNDNGVIVIHDTLPEKEEYATEERNTRIWYGTVWKFAMILSEYKGIDFCTVNIDCGCTVISKKEPEYEMNKNIQNSWNNYVHIKDSFLRIIEPSQIDNYL